MRIECYQPESHRTLWDEFVRHSRNGTFLFLREYMDYHADRFQDASLLFWDQDSLQAILPASLHDDRVISHGGLTYGGLLLAPKTGAAQALTCFSALRSFLASKGVVALSYRMIPSFYHHQPAQDDRYALFRLGGSCIRVDVSSAVALPRNLPMQERRLRGIRKASGVGLRVEESTCWVNFWEILQENLRAKHGTRPVHSLDEILLLARRFPDEIHLFVVRDNDSVLAGVVIYETPTVAHAQYIASSVSGQHTGALDLLFGWLIDEYYADRKKWFDFGISTESGGHVLNEGLLAFKEGFGARSVCYEHWLLPCATMEVR